MASLAQFVSQWTGRCTGFPGWSPPNQCTDLALEWIAALGLPTGDVHGNAIQWASESLQGFSWVANDATCGGQPSQLPSPGDLVVWHGGYHGVGSSGHVDIAVSGITQSGFTGFDQNWPVGSCPHLQAHDYCGVLGWQHLVSPPSGGSPPPNPCAACPRGWSCTGGACVPPCPACDACSTCQGGQCYSSCPEGWSCSGGLCSPPPSQGPPSSSTAASGAWGAVLAVLGAAGIVGGAIFLATAPEKVARVLGDGGSHLRPGPTPGLGPARARA